MRPDRPLRRPLAGLAGLAVLLSGCSLLPFGTPETPGPTPAAEFVLPTPKQTYPNPGSPDRPVDQHSDAQPPGFVTAPAGSGYARYLDQELTWTDCDDQKCTTFAAPLDWTDPDGQAITIAMRMAPATGRRSGVLFINPGGPGGSAQDYVSYFDTTGLERFDVIGLDSRGSGASTPVVCGTGPQTDRYFDADSTPDDQTEQDALVAAQREFNAQCRANSGRLLDHITSIETIYDYDLARHLLGEEKINFYGVSYGTYLGAVYAELYPGNVGRMVLDSAVNLTPDSEVIQAQGFDLSLRNFAKWCAQNPADCQLGGTEDEVVQRIVDFLNGLDAAPLPTDLGRTLTQSLAVTGLVIHFYYGAELYPYLAMMLSSTMSTGNGTDLLQAADLMNERDPVSGEYGALTYSFPAIRCVDEPDKGMGQAFADWHGRNSELAPIFGPLFGPDLVCALWTAQPAPMIDFTGAGAPPLLIVQNTGDSATPYLQAEIMEAELESAVLVSRDAPGHGAYNAGSPCLDAIVRDYLVDGKVPDEGTRCTDG